MKCSLAVGNCDIPGPASAPAFTPTIPETPLSLFQASILGATIATNVSPTIVNGDLDLSPDRPLPAFLLERLLTTLSILIMRPQPIQKPRPRLILRHSTG